MLFNSLLLILLMKESLRIGFAVKHEQSTYIIFHIVLATLLLTYNSIKFYFIFRFILTNKFTDSYILWMG